MQEVHGVAEAPARNGLWDADCEGRRAFDDKNHGKAFPGGLAFPSESQDAHQNSEVEGLQPNPVAANAKLENPPSPIPAVSPPPGGLEVTPKGVACPTPKSTSAGPPKRKLDDEDYVTMSLPPPPLTDQAVYGRMYRIFQRKKNGSKLLDDRWCEAWADVRGGGRESLKAMFEKVGYDPDRVVKKYVQLLVSFES